MKSLTALPLIGLALTLAACGKDADGNNATAANSTASAVSAPAGSAWTDTVSKTAEGGFVIGNPQAAVKLIEYGALSCSHCAEFSEKSHDKLMSYVAKGTVSFEFRPFMLNSYDLPASLLARCSGPGPFFTIAHQMFEAQADFFAKAQSVSPAEQQSWQGLKENQLAAAIGKAYGFDSFVQQRGISTAQANACLADTAAIKELETMMQNGVKQFQITGTPTFIINGQKQDVNTWEAVEPLLIAAGA
ncbi:thioredoxin domain-containing protein [Sphingomonas colocasiae]|uniref:DsbA family protein n=1 Tax=Sphingomonas colocasiae TaxID=1848973 RepID=A0ABS7Q0B6_9SPHN|nr:thioredoxin domain-containing protein [Sphingomonas colocasiae]MBY8826007.1 DsbA family protein [Sphingomonas colocasiae]